MISNLMSNVKNHELGIVSIEYAIIGVVMVSVICLILDTGTLYESISFLWNAMSSSTRILGS